MLSYGFSTGALALGDFKRALASLKGHQTKAVELSALRDHELPELMRSVPELDLSGYDYVSVHAPSKFETLSEKDAARLLEPCIKRNWPVILHPDAIQDVASWKRFGSLLCIENMDKRRRIGRTAAELATWFEVFPKASLCLDLGHARQVDPTLSIAHEIVTLFGDRLRQIHLSELDYRSQHKRLSVGAVSAIQKVAGRLKPVAVILESVVHGNEIETELEMARAALEPRIGTDAVHDATVRSTRRHTYL